MNITRAGDGQETVHMTVSLAQETRADNVVIEAGKHEDTDLIWTLDSVGGAGGRDSHLKEWDAICSRYALITYHLSYVGDLNPPPFGESAQRVYSTSRSGTETKRANCY